LSAIDIRTDDKFSNKKVYYRGGRVNIQILIAVLELENSHKTTENKRKSN